MKIRFATEKDIDFLMEGRRKIREAENRTHIEKGERDLEEFTQAVSEKKVRVAEVGGERAGYLFFKMDFDVMYMEVMRPFLWVQLVYVDKMFRGRGIGKALYEDVFKIAKENGCKRVALDVFDFNEIRGSAPYNPRCVGGLPLRVL